MFGRTRARVSELEQINAEQAMIIQRFSELISVMRGSIVTVNMRSEKALGLVPIYRNELENFLITQEFGDGNGLDMGQGLLLEIKSDWMKVIRKYWGADESITQEIDGNDLYDGRYMP